MAMEPPPFQEASRCDVCKCSFSTFRRRHHCRCCGRTLCAEHSSDQMALPQFGIHSNVRVCAVCFNGGSRLQKDSGPDPNAVKAVTDSISTLDISTVSDTKAEASVANPPFPTIVECKCGMPLCICEAPAPPKESMTSQQLTTTSNTSLHSTSKPKKAETTPRNRGSTSNSRPSTLFTPGQIAKSSVDMPSINYEVTGEGLREAIKNGDTAAAKKLLSQGVDANYLDKQGSSLLHLVLIHSFPLTSQPSSFSVFQETLKNIKKHVTLHDIPIQAAVFNQTEIVYALMDNGASLECKNSQGETPLDCAPATLQYKMKKKVEENTQMDT